MSFLFKITHEIKILLFASAFANEPVFKLVLARLESSKRFNMPVCSTGADVANVAGTRKGMFPSWLYWVRTEISFS